jgi:hypothetical protein
MKIRTQKKCSRVHILINFIGAFILLNAHSDLALVAFGCMALINIRI